jgi:hypothetical protein
MCQLYPPSGITTKTHKEVATDLAAHADPKVKVSPATVRRARTVLKPAQSPAQEPEQG